MSPSVDGIARRAEDRGLRRVERLGLGPAMSLILVALVVWLVKADHTQRTDDRTAFVAALAQNTAAVKELAGEVGKVATANAQVQAVYEVLCKPLPVVPVVRGKR